MQRDRVIAELQIFIEMQDGLNKVNNLPRSRVYPAVKEAIALLSATSKEEPDTWQCCGLEMNRDTACPVCHDKCD